MPQMLGYLAAREATSSGVRSVPVRAREVVENDRELRGLSDAAEVVLGSRRARAKVVRGHREHRVGASLLGIAGELQDVGVVRVANTNEDLHAIAHALHGKVASVLLVLERDAVELANAAKEQNAVETGVGKVVEMLAPQIEIDVALIISNGNGRTENALEHVTTLPILGTEAISALPYLYIQDSHAGPDARGAGPADIYQI